MNWVILQSHSTAQPLQELVSIALCEIARAASEQPCREAKTATKVLFTLCESIVHTQHYHWLG